MNKKFSTRENVVKQVSHIINALSTKRFLLTSLSIYNLVVIYLELFQKPEKTRAREFLYCFKNARKHVHANSCAASKPEKTRAFQSTKILFFSSRAF